jgi:hypothetical protein
MFQINDEAVEPDSTQPFNNQLGDDHRDDLQPAPKHLSGGYVGAVIPLAVSTYRPSDLILDILMNPNHRNFFQRVHHDGVEIYASRPDYLITAGGYWMGSPYTAFGASDSDDDGPAVTTTLMPTGHLVRSEDMIRIDGPDVTTIDARWRINTCVAPDFACGVNPVVPDLYKQNKLCFSHGRPMEFYRFLEPRVQ